MLETLSNSELVDILQKRLEALSEYPNVALVIENARKIERVEEVYKELMARWKALKVK